MDAVLGDCQRFGRAFVDFSPTMRPKLPEVSKIHTARKSEQVIVRLILRERDLCLVEDF